MKKILALFFVISFFTPALSLAQNFNSDGTVKLDYGGLVKCDGVVDKNNPEEVARNNECDFQDLMGMVNSIIQWIFMLSIPIFIGLFAYAGFLYMTPSPGNREKSNKMLWAALKGFVIMLIAWFMVSTLLSWIVSDSFKGTASSLLE
ncbi:MAG: hypothetical protein QG640_595 [Patescibacteria group bacterium]|nr:hypothetical protein [Patescibacteria group bacterium]